MNLAPVPGSYWADTKLLAGPLPTAPEREALRAQLRALLDAGVYTVIDLRTPAEAPGVRSLMEKLAREEEPVAWLNYPITDGAAPSVALLELILDAIDASIARGRGVYVHCAGGRGRTGTVIACWWIRHGHYDPDAALEELQRRREGILWGDQPSPETGAQYRLVRSWRRGA